MTEAFVHPGTIRTIDEYNKQERVVPAASVPERQRFVMLDREGVETQDSQLAVTRLPIVLVRVAHLDAAGALVPPDRAVEMRVLEFGPDDRLLRSTLLFKD